jgi:hypothetical protein
VGAGLEHHLGGKSSSADPLSRYEQWLCCTCCTVEGKLAVLSHKTVNRTTEIWVKCDFLKLTSSCNFFLSFFFVAL